MSNYNEALTANNTELSAIQSDAASSNTRLQAVLDKINALPDAGSGGGASLDTCTVIINSSTSIGTLYRAVATRYVDGAVAVYDYMAAYDESNISLPITIENVICGSGMAVDMSGASIPYYEASGATVKRSGNSINVHITAAAGETVVINYIDKD